MPSDEPTPVDALPKRRRRWVKWLKRMLLALVVGVLLLVGWEFVTWQLAWREGNAKLQPLVAELDATDPDWRAADLCVKRNARLAPPESNTAELAVAVAKRLTPDARLTPPVRKWWDRVPYGQLPDRSQVAELSAVLEKNRDAVLSARALRERPNSGLRSLVAEPTGVMTLNSDIGGLLDINFLMTMDVLERASEGRGADALSGALAQLAVASGVGDDPFIMAQNIRMAAATGAARSAERTLGLGQPPSDSLAAIQLALDRESAAPRLRHGFRGERAVMFHTLECVNLGVLSAADVFELARRRDHRPVGASLGSRIEEKTYTKAVPDQQARVIDTFGRLLTAADEPYGPNRAKLFSNVEMALQGEFGRIGSPDNSFIRKLFPNVSRFVLVDLLTTALLRTTVAAVACERFRMKTGRFPISLAGLPKEILPAIPEDPFTGTSVRFKTTDMGLIVYSVGIDMTDDGGDVTASPKDEPGTDIGFTLLDPKHRRQPPAAKPDE